MIATRLVIPSSFEIKMEAAIEPCENLSSYNECVQKIHP